MLHVFLFVEKLVVYHPKKKKIAGTTFYWNVGINLNGLFVDWKSWKETLNNSSIDLNKFIQQKHENIRTKWWINTYNISKWNKYDYLERKHNTRLPLVFRKWIPVDEILIFALLMNFLKTGLNRKLWKLFFFCPIIWWWKSSEYLWNYKCFYIQWWGAQGIGQSSRNWT